MKLVQVSFAFVLCVASTYAFSVTSFCVYRWPNPEPNYEVTEGHDVVLTCLSDQRYKKCQFTHGNSDKTCEFEWKAWTGETFDANSNVTQNCNGADNFGNRAEFAGSFYEKDCTMKLRVMPSDKGNWTCKMTTAAFENDEKTRQIKVERQRRQGGIPEKAKCEKKPLSKKCL